jgi:hypothetical protein
MNKIYFTLIALVFFVSNAFSQITYYSKATATDFNAVASWGTNTDGSGATPGSISNVDNFVVQNLSALTLSSNASVKNLTLTTGSLTVGANVLTVAPSSGNNSILLVNGGTLNMGVTSNVTLNGSFSMTTGVFNQSGGTMIIDGNNNNIVASSAVVNTTSLALFYFSGGTLNCTAGNITIVDPPATATPGGATAGSGISQSVAIGSSSQIWFSGTHTFIIGDGVSTTQGNSDGFVLETYFSGFSPLNNLTINSGNTPNRWAGASNRNSTAYGLHVKGTLTVNAGCEIRQLGTGSLFNVAGNIVNDGIITVLGTGSTTGLTLGIGGVSTTSAQLLTGSGIYRNSTTASTANFSNLAINNNSTGGVTFATANSLLSPGNTGTVSGTLTITNGIINTSSSVFTLGISATTVGTLTYTAGGFTTGSTFSRWFATAGTGTTIAASTIPTLGAGSFPFVNGNPVIGMNARHFHRNTTALTTAGTINVTFNDGSGLTTITPVTESTFTIDRKTNSNWVVSYGNGAAATATPTVCIQGAGTWPNLSINNRLLVGGALLGTHQAGTSLPMVQRTAIPAANFVGTYSIGAISSEVPNLSVNSGKWEDPATWTSGVPTCAQSVGIVSGHTITFDAASGTLSNGSILISAGANMIVSGGTLTVGCTNNNSILNNSGTLTVTAGTLNVNGNINSPAGSTINQSGGNINVDGNSGVTGTSVATGTYLINIVASAVTNLNLTGGTLTIVDPHFGTATSDYCLYINQGGAYNSASTTHTLKFGNGVSNTVGGHTNGFYYYLFPGSYYFGLGNVVVDALTGTNRFVKNLSTTTIKGDLTITSGDFQINTTTFVAGNIVNTGILTAASTLNFANTTQGSTTAPSTNAQSVSGTGTFRNSATTTTANFISLTINNTSAGGVTIPALSAVTPATNPNPANTSSFSGTLTFTAGKLNTGGTSTMISGIGGATPAVGTVAVTSGGFSSGSSFGRWATAATTGTSIAAGTDPTSTTSQYPFVMSNGTVRNAWIERNTPSAAGILVVKFVETPGITPVTIVDGAYTVQQIGNDNFTVSTLGTTPNAATYELAIVAPDVLGGTLSAPNTRLTQAAAVIGTHQAGTVTPCGQRLLTLAQLTAAPFYVGANIADIPNSSIASGSWNATTTWSKGTVPTCSDNVLIKATHSVVISTTGNNSNGVTINTGGTLTLDSNGDLTVGCTNKNSLFSINGGTFDLQRGALNVNGKFALTANVAGIFKQSGGTVTVDGNSGTLATSINGHLVDLYCHTTSTLQLTMGDFIVVNPSISTTTTDCSFKVFSSVAHSSGPDWNLKLGNGVSAINTPNANGFLMNLYNNTTGFNYFKIGGTLTINTDAGSASIGNRHVTTSNTIPLNNLTITSGDYRALSIQYFSGNLINNDSMTSTSTNIFSEFSGTTGSAGTIPQTISGTGVFRNSTTAPTAGFTSMTINNGGGVTLNTPLSVGTTLFLTTGNLNTTATNIMTIGYSTAAGSVSGGSASSFINGPLQRYNVANKTATWAGASNTSLSYPLGKNTTFLPIYVDASTNSGGPVIFKAEAFDANTGTSAPGVSNLSSSRWEVAPTPATDPNFVGAIIGAGSFSMLPTPVPSVLGSTSASGTYDGILGTGFVNAGLLAPFPANSIRSTAIITKANFKNFWSFGDLTPCAAPDPVTSLVATQLGSTGFIGTFAAPTTAGTQLTNYLVLRAAAGSATPVVTNGTTYTTAPSGYTLVGYVVPTMFTQTGLTAATTYDYYVFTNNNNACSGGPIYSLSTKLTVTTCAAVTNPPTLLVTTLRTTTALTFAWTAPTPVPASYDVDVCLDAAYTTYLPGYNSLNVGSATTLVLTGLTPQTRYYVRVRAKDGAGCYSANLTGSNATSCNATTIPFAENFNSSGVSCASVINANGDANTWALGTAPASPVGMTGSVGVYAGSSTIAADDWFYLQGVMLTAGTSYDFRYKYATASTAANHSMEVFVNNAISNSGATVLRTFTGITGITLKNDTSVFIAPANGIYYFGFRAISPAGATSLYVEDINIVETPPCAGSNGGTIATTAGATICGSFSSTFTASGYSRGLGIIYQWQSSTDNFATVITDLNTQNPFALPFNESFLSSGNNQFRLKVTCTNTSTTGFSNVLTINYSNPQPLTTTGATRCGIGTVTLNATASPGDQLNWFTTPTGGIPVTLPYSNIPVTGFNNDIVANGTGSSTILGLTSTAIGVDGQAYYFVDNTFKYTSGSAVPTCFMPTNKIIPSSLTSGLNYVLQNYGTSTANNSNALTLANASTTYTSPYPSAGTMTLTTPASFATLKVLYESVITVGTQTVNATVTFTDATTQVLPTTSIVNWYTASGVAYNGIGRGTPTGATECLTTGPNLFELSIPINTANQSKLVQSVTFSLPGVFTTGTTPATVNYFHALAIGGQGVATPGSFTTPVISATTTYYVAATGSGSTTQTANHGLPTVTTSTQNTGLLFDLNVGTTITSIDVYSTAAGTVTVSILNSALTNIYTSTAIPIVAGTLSTPQTIPLGASLPAGTGYRILVSNTGNALGYHTGTFPIPLGNGVGNITTGATATGTTTLNYFVYNMTTTVGCSGVRVPVVATVTTPPALSASATLPTVCSGTSTVVSVSSPNDPAYTYTWTPTNQTGATQTVTPVSTSNSTTTIVNYTVTASDNTTGPNGGCVNIATVPITVNPQPLGLTASASLDTICSGTSVNLTSNSTSVLKLIDESFEGTTFAPTGWALVNNGTGNNWISTTGANHTAGGTKSMRYTYNTSNAADAWSFTPNQTLTAGKTYTFSFWWGSVYPSTIYNEKLKVTVGSAQTVVSQTTTLFDTTFATQNPTPWQLKTITFVPATTGNYNFAFNCYSIVNQAYVEIDDVLLTTNQALTYAWSSDPTGFTASTQNVTGVLPASTTIYIATATNSPFGCSSSARDTVVIRNLSAGTITGAATVPCNGTSTLTATGASGSGTWTSSATGVATVNVTTGLVTAVSPGTTTITFTVTNVCGTASTTKDITVGGCAIPVNAKVYLSNIDSASSLMSTNLIAIDPGSASPFPMDDPYFTGIYAASGNYAHIPNVTTPATTATILSTNNIVDWIFVELRTGTSGATTVAYAKAALLRNDGIILNSDGTPLSFAGASSTTEYFVAIKHRNHIGFMTASDTTFTITTPLLNFTSSLAPLYGSNPLRLAYPAAGANPAKYVMWAGDGNVSTDVDPLDLSAMYPLNGNVLDEYNPWDMDFDTAVDTPDLLLVYPNNGNIIQQID